jgi:hypothetical protein
MIEGTLVVVGYLALVAVFYVLGKLMVWANDDNE